MQKVRLSLLKYYYLALIIIILELSVVADNQTRWNSTYLMLQRALKLRQRLGVFIDEAVDKENSPLNPVDSISKDDWTTLQIMHDLLKPF